VFDAAQLSGVDAAGQARNLDLIYDASDPRFAITSADVTSASEADLAAVDSAAAMGRGRAASWAIVRILTGGSSGVITLGAAALVGRAHAIVRLARGAAVIESRGASGHGAQAAGCRRQAAGRRAVR
jgi:hypothetical protein